MNWQNNNNKLEKEFVLKSFSEIVQKLTLVSKVADELNHHPDFSVYGYKKIKFSLSTHDQGNSVTDKDHELAKKLDVIFEGE